MNPRDELQAIQSRIDTLNHLKGPIVAAWEGEKHRQGDPGLKKPPELRKIDGELFFLYDQRDAILRDHPRLQSEFGPKSAKKNFAPTSWMPTRAAQTSADRAKRKKNIHPGFKEWCAAQRPQIKCSLENWEDAVIRRRFLEHLEAERQGEEAALAAAPAAGAEAPDDVVVTTNTLYGGRYPFGIFLDDMAPDKYATPKAVLAAWKDAELRQLYDLWVEERKRRDGV